MNRNAIMSLAMIAAMSFPAHADELEWLARDYDFGTLREAAGKATGRVRFINRGSSPTIISGVRPSCGCTGAEYTEGLIMPGDTATISFTYDPAGRPGRFEKTVRVFTGADRDQTVIPIRGIVIGAPATLERDYPYETGGLRYDKREIHMPDLRYGTSRHEFVRLYNQTDKPIRPEVESDNAALTVELARKEIAAGDIGTLSLYLNTRDTDGPGPFRARVRIKPDSGAGEMADIIYEAGIVADTSHLTPEQIAGGPRCSVARAVTDLGRLKPGDSRKFEIEVVNDGRSPLVISKVYSRSGQVEIKSWPQVLPSGKKGKIGGVLHVDADATGAQRHTIEIHSDDALHPVVKADISGMAE